MLDHLSEVSVFGHSALALFLILGMDLAFTLIHVLKELKGDGGPLWKNFGAIVGVCVPSWLGFTIFTLGLTAVLWLVGFVAISGILPTCAAAALGALVGARVGDTLVSHVLLYTLRYRPNPGLKSTALYVAEALFLIATFSKGLRSGGVSTYRGLAVGAGAFCIVLPMLRSLRIIKPSWKRDPPWRRGEDLSSWVAKNCPG